MTSPEGNVSAHCKQAADLEASETHLAGFDHADALKDLGQVAQVEGVVRTSRCWQQLLTDPHVHLNAALYHSRSKARFTSKLNWWSMKPPRMAVNMTLRHTYRSTATC